MPQKDTSQLKQKIISTLEQKGPSLPVHISREIEQSILFTSAFLSELLSEKRIKISSMKVGNSPIYYLRGQESQLENYSYHLKSKEKEAYTLLKEKRFLKDTQQDPAIRVALRAIKDFAVPFRKNEELIWRYYLTPQEEYNLRITSKEKKREEGKEGEQKEQKSEKESQQFEKKAEELDIFDKEKKKPKKTKTKKRKKNSSQKDNRFFNTIKEHLSKNNVEIVDIVEITKENITFKVTKNGEEYLIIAYNKKRISEEEINKAYKKSSELEIPYKIISFGEPLKRVNNLINAIKHLKDIEKIE